MNSRFLGVLRLTVLPFGLILLILVPLEWLLRALWRGFFLSLARLFFFVARRRGEPPLTEAEADEIQQWFRASRNGGTVQDNLALLTY